MSIIQGNVLAATTTAYQIANSVRFRSAASAYLSRIPTSASNRQKFTWSGWVKRGALSSRMSFFVGGVTSTGNNVFVLQFDASDRLEVLASTWGSSLDWDVVSTQVFRDPSAWYHIVLSFDSANATAANRALLYVNGVQITALAVASYPALNYTTAVNNTVSHVMGCSIAGQYHLDGYVSDVNFVDGQALTPSSFGEFSAEYGQWIPKRYTGTYGTNGFYLPFNDGSNLTNLCLDRSGNANNWTATNISLTAGATYDWMLDTPTNNHAVLNAIYSGRSSLSNGNLTASGDTDLPTIIPESGSGTWYFERGGASQTWTPPAAFPAGTGDYNFGQRPWQSTGPTAGQKVLRISDLPIPTIVNPKLHFDTVLATGANIKTTTEAVFPSNFFEWIKDRANVNNHQLIDTVRGSSAILQSNTTEAETTYSTPTGDSVGWVWKAGGSAVSNTAGSITSQVSANTTAGFSIVTYTGTGANATVGHGLGVAPKFIVYKRRNAGADSWVVYHQSITNSQDGGIYLNTTNAWNADATLWNSTAPTSSVFSVGTYGSASAVTMVAYCFAEVPGFSKIGSYIGNGATDGPFVYCGFKPRFVMIKRTDATGNWRIVDTARSTYNANGLDLYPNLSNAEGTVAFDFLSNGFKPRVTDADYNTNGGSYIFYAVAESPFNYSTAR